MEFHATVTGSEDKRMSSLALALQGLAHLCWNFKHNLKAVVRVWTASMEGYYGVARLRLSYQSDHVA